MVNTSWDKSAKWYNSLLEEKEGTYQKELILPNLLRLLDIKRGEHILDLACGQGFFTREFYKNSAQVTAADISKELIALAQKNSPKEIDYRVSPADQLSFVKKGSVDKAVLTLAIQNIENTKDVFTECARVLKPGGALYITMMHPAFRVPKKSAWGWSDAEKIQYRRIDEYISESKTKIQMHPGDNPREYTLTFHRPLQYYVKALIKTGFAVTGLEEWTSHRKSEPGPRAKAEDKARKEIPLFLFIKVLKH